MVEARRIERRQAAVAARSQQELRELRGQERAARELARAGWASAHDRRWLAQAGLVEVGRAWSAAAAYADADPDAATALGRCEDRLRHLHPYAMAWYDRLRSQGAGRFDAMRDALPLFGRAPHARPGGPGTVRPALAVGRPSDGGSRGQQRAGGEAGVRVASAYGVSDGLGPVAAPSAAGLAAESFPCTAQDAVHVGASGSLDLDRRRPQAAARPGARPRLAP